MYFILVTNHSSLKALTDKPNLTGRLQQRADKLMEYDFTIKYCSGKSNILPDFLLRIYLVELFNSSDINGIQIARKKNKIFIPFENHVRLIKQSYCT